ncbi:hypothetical protein Dimus_022128, partial [Dionaea muscipula]
WEHNDAASIASYGDELQTYSFSMTDVVNNQSDVWFLLLAAMSKCGEVASSWFHGEA